MSGAAYRRIDVPKSGTNSAEFRSISPLGQVPVLVPPDGAPMTESAAMCLLIAERHPEARIAPPVDGPDRPVFLRWMLFMSAVLYPAVLRQYYAGRYTADPSGVEAVSQSALAEFERGFDLIEAHVDGRDWLCTERSIADVYLLMMQAWHPDDGMVRDRWPNIERSVAVLRNDPVLVGLNHYYDMWK